MPGLLRVKHQNNNNKTVKTTVRGESGPVFFLVFFFGRDYDQRVAQAEGRRRPSVWAILSWIAGVFKNLLNSGIMRLVPGGTSLPSDPGQLTESKALGD